MGKIDFDSSSYTETPLSTEEARKDVTPLISQDKALKILDETEGMLVVKTLY